MQEQSKALAKVEPTRIINGRPELVDSKQLYQFACMVLESGLAPPDLNTPQKIMVAILFATDVGLSVMGALKHVSVINNRPSLTTQGQMALVERSGQLEDLQEGFAGKDKTFHAWVSVKRKGRSPRKTEFSVHDAELAGLWGKRGSWQQYPKRMLMNRALGFALRDNFADIVGGFLTPEEAHDITPLEDVSVMEPAQLTADTHDISAAPAPSAPVETPPLEVPSAPLEPDELDETDPRPAGPGLISEWKERLKNVRYDQAVDIFEREIYPAEEAGRISQKEKEELQEMVLAKGGWGGR